MPRWPKLEPGHRDPRNARPWKSMGFKGGDIVRNWLRFRLLNTKLSPETIREIEKMAEDLD